LITQPDPTHCSSLTISITDQFRLLTSNPLEEYRCRSFFEKEPETVAWIESMIMNEDVMYDVGANVGVYSIYTAIQHPLARVYAFEPLRGNFHRLCDNAQLNAVPNLIPLHFALSDRDGIQPLYVSDYRTGASGSQLGAAVNDLGEPFEPLGVEYVPSMRMDGMVKIFALPPPNHVKIDVDGLEARIIEGMRDLLSGNSVRSILIEVNNGVSDQRSISDCLKSFGFTSEHPLNRLPNHSRHRRQGTRSNLVENVIFVRE